MFPFWRESIKRWSERTTQRIMNDSLNFFVEYATANATTNRNNGVWKGKKYVKA
jgi:hypothetical protein